MPSASCLDAQTRHATNRHTHNLNNSIHHQHLLCTVLTYVRALPCYKIAGTPPNSSSIKRHLYICIPKSPPSYSSPSSLASKSKISYKRKASSINDHPKNPEFSSLVKACSSSSDLRPPPKHALGLMICAGG
jgi:hypothetical protein